MSSPRELNRAIPRNTRPQIQEVLKNPSLLHSEAVSNQKQANKQKDRQISKAQTCKRGKQPERERVRPEEKVSRREIR